jgi:hypothetical protein
MEDSKLCDLTGWSRVGSCNIYTGSAFQNSNDAHSGQCYYYGQCSTHGDILNQNFSTIAGDISDIHFSLTNYKCCSIIEIATITIH